jgi:ubiquinone/menaquinone biosynthesis C-methylase UbiE
MNVTREKIFYDQHPFDWTELYHPDELRRVISPSLLRLVDALPRDALVLDVGCGAGRVTAYLANRGVLCIGLDRSSHSLRIMRERCQRPGAVADNLCLPIKEAVADLVISDGVVHHTGSPQAAFLENCRVLKGGGLLFLSVYKPGGRYEFLYKYPGRLIRWALRHARGEFVVRWSVMPVYYLVHLVKSRGKRTWRGAQNLFYDYFATPQVAFLSRNDVEDWCRPSGMTIVSYDRNVAGNVHSFVLRKMEESVVHPLPGLDFAKN